MIVDRHSKQDPPMYPFIEAIASATEDAMYNTLINAGDALEQAGNHGVALCCYYNILVGVDYDAKWNDTALAGLLRCAHMAGSIDFKTYLGLVLKRKFQAGVS
ncbi:MAG: hypothetical protein JXB88_19070 [Spirochaetales bacterium]|nr:hypothetical protein [Spirochaetales bacterium]